MSWLSQEMDAKPSALERNRPTIRFDCADADEALKDLEVEVFIEALLSGDDNDD